DFPWPSRSGAMTSNSRASRGIVSRHVFELPAMPCTSTMVGPDPARRYEKVWPWSDTSWRAMDVSLGVAMRRRYRAVVANGRIRGSGRSPGGGFTPSYPSVGHDGGPEHVT